MEDTAISAPIPERVAVIAARNGYTGEPSIETLTAGPREPVEQWTWACPTGVEVELLTDAAGGHYWPTESNAGIDGTKLACEFFEQHSHMRHGRRGCSMTGGVGCGTDARRLSFPVPSPQSCPR